MPFVDLLAAIVILSNAVKGVSMLQLARDLDCQYKTAFVLAHKLREAIASEIAARDVDGAKSGPKGKRMVAVFRDGRAFTGTGLKEARRNFSWSPSCLTSNYFRPQFLPSVPRFRREVIRLGY